MRADHAGGLEGLSATREVETRSRETRLCAPLQQLFLGLLISEYKLMARQPWIMPVHTKSPFPHCHWSPGWVPRISSAAPPSLGVALTINYLGF